ncbi:MAG: SGNH/GDSL hydrolase family protein [bacterium]|nr:SGNH/GDSL hydrolase family protein [Clostridium sp.]MCM1537222.1 SGNH/GDSL hydrolase family protein [bacterium]
MEVKGFAKAKFAYTTSLEDVIFPSEESEQAIADSMTSKEYTDYLYRQAVDFFCTTKIDLDWDHILCVGDSITLGVQTGVEEPYPNNYPEIVATLFHTSVENEGIGGSTIWGSGPYAMCKRIVNYGPADAVFILGGTNDWFFGEECKLGDLNSPITFTYDFNWLCENLESYYPNAEIFFIIPMDPAEYIGVEKHDDDFDVIRNVERTIAANHGFHIIDLPARNILSGLDPEIKSAYYSDHCHLNTYGYETLGKIVAYEALKEMFAH